jgi:hypothetical protein
MMAQEHTSDVVVVVSRVTLPRYEMRYARADRAQQDAQSVVRSNAFSVPVDFPEPVGQEVVLDLGVNGIVLTVTLLFRVVQKSPSLTAFDWWARRSTDRDVFALWVQELKHALHPETAPPKTSIVPLAMTRLFETCRRVGSPNLFVALGVHWGAIQDDVDRGYEETSRELDGYARLPDLSSRARTLLEEARKKGDEAYAKLCIPSERHQQRVKYVSAEKMAQARELVLSKMDIARLREDGEELERLRKQREELYFGSPRM